MTPGPRVFARFGAAAIVATALVAAAPVAHTADEPCPSAEACLAKSFDRDWDRYYDVIQKTWADKKAVAELLQKAEKLNRPDILAQVKARQAAIEERWKFASAIGAALTTPRFQNFVIAQRDEAVKVHAAASMRSRKETDLYRRLARGSLGQEREGVLRDIQGYESEAKMLRETFHRDLMIVSLNAIKETPGAVAEQWTKIPEVLTKYGIEPTTAGVSANIVYVQVFDAQLAAGYAAFEAVHGGMTVEEATRRHQTLPALFEATRAASGGALRLAELVAKMPASKDFMSEAFGPIALRAGIYANLLALGLDTTLTLSAVSRLKDSEARQARVEASDAVWRGRVDASTRIAADAAAREARANRQVENQRRVEALFRQIRQEGGQ
jgi:hypothetical protein